MEKTFKGSKLNIVASLLILIGAFSRIRIIFSRELNAIGYITNIALIIIFLTLGYRAFLMYTDNVKVCKHNLTITSLFSKKTINTRDIKSIDTTKNPVIIITKNNKYLRLNIPNLSEEDKNSLKNLYKTKKK